MRAATQYRAEMTASPPHSPSDRNPKLPLFSSEAVKRDRLYRDVQILIGVTLLAVLVRLWLMAAQPLTDLTEARYGELARVTADGNYWLMPHITPAKPFLAKPPLATWLAAASWKFLGQNELCLRLPSLAVSVAAAVMLVGVASDFGSRRTGKHMLVAMLATSPVWIVSAGSVMTDATQMAVVTGAMTASWLSVKHPQTRRWRILFWTLVGVASLSKGVATLALIGLPLAAYCLFGSGWKVLPSALYDRNGIALATAVTLAWYVPAELAYPGFLKYFLIGEHLQRFLQPDWGGDKFGHAHSVPKGTIWLFWAAATCFWLPVMLEELCMLARNIRSRCVPQPDIWLWCWILAPLIFFTFANNILWTYTLTAIPPFALLVGGWAERSVHVGRRLTPSLLAISSLVAAWFCLYWAPSKFESRSARTLVEQAEALRPEEPLYFSDCFTFSSSFYTKGTAIRADGPEGIELLMRQPGAVFITTAAQSRLPIERGRARVLAESSGAALLETLPKSIEEGSGD